jgi:hypothetical protein
MQDRNVFEEDSRRWYIRDQLQVLLVTFAFINLYGHEH